MRSNEVNAKGGMQTSTGTTIAFRTATHADGCPKCGRHDVMLRYEPPLPPSTPSDPAQFLPRARPTAGERMHVQCETCGYEWHEPTRDAKPGD